MTLTENLQAQVQTEAVLTYQGDVHAQGEQVALRDVNNYYASHDPDFVELPQNTGEEQLPEPVFTEAVKEQLLLQHIQILAGGQGFDKEGFLHQIAHSLQGGILDGYPLRELRDNPESQNIIRLIAREERPSVFLLPRIHPQHLGYDLQGLQEVAASRKHYLLLSTEAAAPVWQLSPVQASHYWFEVPTEELYDPAELCHFLLHTLSSLEAQPEWIPGKLSADDSLVAGGRSIASLCKQLNTPLQARLLARLLSLESDAPTPERLQELLTQVSDSTESLIGRWFHSLPMHQQLIALAATLCEGMYDDQFFSVVNEAVRGFWEYRDQRLRCLDYCDLDFLLPFFELEAIHDEKRVMRSRFSGQRTGLIHAAWNSHRRHLLDMLPQLVGLVFRTVKLDQIDFERFGTMDRRSVLRETISKTLSDVGTISLPVVQSPLLELIASGNTTISRVAAKALARWRELGEEELLFGTLERWQRSEEIKELVEELQKSARLKDFRKQNIGARSLSIIRANTVMVLSYTAAYDQPNQLHERIISQLSYLAQERDHTVQKAINEALPRFIHHHVFQMRELLQEQFIRYDDMQEAIGIGLAKAYIDYPKDLRRSIDHWLEEAMQEESADNRRQKMTFRDKLLSTVLAFWQEIDFLPAAEEEDAQERYTLSEVLDLLAQLYAREGRDRLRQQIKTTAFLLMQKDWNLAGRYISTYCDALSPEATQVIDLLYASYVAERKALGGGDYTLRFGREEDMDDYTIWLDADARPLTYTEKALFRWLEKGDENLRRLAAWAFTQIAALFEAAEQEAVAKLRWELQQQSRVVRTVIEEVPGIKLPARKAFIRPMLPILNLWTRLMVLLILWDEGNENRDRLKSMYRYLLYRKQTTLPEMALALQKWKMRGTEPVQQLGGWLEELIRRTKAWNDIPDIIKVFLMLGIGFFGMIFLGLLISILF